MDRRTLRSLQINDRDIKVRVIVLDILECIQPAKRARTGDRYTSNVTLRVADDETACMTKMVLRGGAPTRAFGMQALAEGDILQLQGARVAILEEGIRLIALNMPSSCEKVGSITLDFNDKLDMSESLKKGNAGDVRKRLYNVWMIFVET